MENITLTLDPQVESDTLDHPTEDARLRDLLTITDQLRQLLERQDQRINELFDLLKQAPIRPSRPRRARDGMVLCLPCGSACPAQDESCKTCGAALRTLGQLARDELSMSLEGLPGRFASPGWQLIGACPVECGECSAPLFCAVKLYDRGGQRQKYWALLCPGCSTTRGLTGLWREQKEALNQWARGQSMLAPAASSGQERTLSPTLSATWEAIRAGLDPEQVAASRGLAVSTIYGHLGLLVQMEHCSLRDLVSPQIVDCIVEAHTRYPRPVDLADLESRLPMPLLRQDITLVVRALNLEMGLGDPVDDASRDRVRQTMAAALRAFDNRLTTRDLLGIVLGTEGYRTGPFANRACYGALRGFAQEALAQELRALLKEGRLLISEAKKLVIACDDL